MPLPPPQTSQQLDLPAGIAEFIAAFMRAYNTARLYARGHDLFKKNALELHGRLEQVAADQGFLFLGCAKEALFMGGAFYAARDAHLKAFLKILHNLGISHILIDKGTSIEELGSVVAILAGARQGQGGEVASELMREGIRRVKVGLLDYTVFSTVQTVSAHLAQTGEEEAIWRQLILLPAAAAFNLTPEKVRQLSQLAEDAEELKRLLLSLDKEMTEKHAGISPAHRGTLLANFVQNLGQSLAGIDPEKRGSFAAQVGAIIGSMEPSLKTQILGSIEPGSYSEEEAGVIHEIIQAIPDNDLVYLLLDALGEGGAESPCFRNLFQRALAKYKDPGVLLALIRQEMLRAASGGRPGASPHWQHLENLVTQEQEAETLNRRFHQDIEALATSIQLQRPLAADEEMKRLLGTMSSESLRAEKARLAVDLINRIHPSRADKFLPSFLNSLAGILSQLLQEKEYGLSGNLIRELALAFRDQPKDIMVKKVLNGKFGTDEVRRLCEDLISQCRAYDPQETSGLNAVCQVFPEKAGTWLLDLFLQSREDNSPMAGWMLTALAGLGPFLSRIIIGRFNNASIQQLPRLLSLAAVCGDPRLAMAVEPLLEHQDHEIRIHAATALGRLRAERAVPRLTEILLQKSWLKTKKTKNLQAAAARALSEIGSSEARVALEKALSEGSGEVQAICRELV